MRNLALHLLKDSKQAAGASFLLALLALLGLPLGWLCAFLVGLVTLAKGAREGFKVLAWAALPAVALLVLGQPAPFVGFVLLRAFIIWGLALVLRKCDSWTLVVELMALIGLFAVILIHLLAGDVANWWLGQLVNYLQWVNESFNLGMSALQVKTMAAMTAKSATGLLTTFLLTIDLLILMLARYAQTRLLSAAQCNATVRDIRLGYTASGLLLAALVGMCLHVSLAYDVMPIMIALFALSGLSVLHALVQHQKNGIMLLVGVYSLLIPFLFYMATLLAVLGLIDTYCDFRRWQVLVKT